MALRSLRGMVAAISLAGLLALAPPCAAGTTTISATAAWTDFAGPHSATSTVSLTMPGRTKSASGILYGDANGDGMVDAQDLVAAFAVFLGEPPSPELLATCDVRPRATDATPMGDGRISADDIQWLALRVMGIVASP